MTSQLVYFSGGRSDDMTDYILQQSRGTSSVTFQCRLPRSGLYKLQVPYLVLVINVVILLDLIERYI